MLRNMLLPAAALAAVLSFASVPAKAGVGFGVTIAPPVYSYPAPYVNPYVDPYAYPGYYDYYTAPAPAYVYPYAYGYGGWHRDYDRGRRGGDFDRGGHFGRGGEHFGGGGQAFHGGGGGHRR